MIKKILASVLAAFVLCVAPAAFAQNETPANPEAVAAAKDVLEAMQYRRLMLTSMQEMAKMMPVQLKQNMIAQIAADTRSGASDKAWILEQAEKTIPEMVAAMQGVFDDPQLIEQLGAENAAAYARTYNADELRQLAAFYRSPLGQKMLSAAPRLATEGFAISNRILMPRLNSRIEPLMRKFIEDTMKAELEREAAEREKK